MRERGELTSTFLACITSESQEYRRGAVWWQSGKVSGVLIPMEYEVLRDTLWEMCTRQLLYNSGAGRDLG